MTAVRRLMTIVGLALAATASAQQQTTPPPAAAETTQAIRTTEPVTADTDRDVNDPRVLRLSLSEAIQTSLRQNLGIELERYSTLQDAQSLVAQYGIYDPVVSGQLRHSTDESAVISAADASSSSNTSADVSLSQNLPTGGFYTVGASNSRFTSSGGFAQLSPGYTSGLNFGLTQPLARDFGIDITRRGINIARNTLGISREQFRNVLLNTTHSVEQAYYDLIYARQYVDVVKEALFLARDQSRITQIRIDVGASAPLDILQPRVQIATTEESLIVAVADVRSAEDRLRQLMNLPPEEWDRPIVPSENVRFSPTTIDVQGAVARAYELRPEIRQNSLATENARVEYTYARNQVLPQVDAIVGYNLAGAAGRTVNSQGQPVPGVPQTGFSQALEQVFGFDFPGWNVGVNLGIPVFNTSARAIAKRAELDLLRSRTSEAQTRQIVAVEVRSAARAIDTSAKEITASGAAREAAEQNLDAERKRYENGMTTNFQVLQVQQQLSDARARELRALVAYNKAVAAYHRAVGDLLETRNIAVEEPALEREPQIFSSWSRYNWLNFDKDTKAEEAKK